MRLAIAAVLTLAFACSRPPVQAPQLEAPDEDLAPLATAAPSKIAEKRATTTPVLTRVDLDRVLDDGPGAFLTRVEVRPHFDGKRFAGWELVAFIDPSSAVARSGLIPGDVIRAVNDHRLERPEHLHELWQNLRVAQELVVTGLRAGQPLELRFTIEAASRPEPATTAM